MRAAVLALLFSAFATPAAADRFSLAYDGAGLGFVPLGELTIDAFVTDEDYNVAATIESGGLLNLFERTAIRVRSSGRIADSNVWWERYDLDHHYSRKHRVIAMTNAGGAVNAEITPNYRLWGDPPATDEQRQRSRDPLSTMVAMAIDVGQTRRCSGSYPTFDGRFHYILELGAGEVDQFEGGGYEGDVLKCALAYIAVSGFERTDSGRRRIPQGSVWFALAPDSIFAPPVRIATPVSAGGAVIRLRSWRRVVVDVQTASP
jgi:hypothetical protein